MSKRNIYTFATILLLVGLGFIFSSKFNKTNAVVDNTQQVDSSVETIVSDSYTLSEISTHSDANDCFMAINGKVYDVTDYIASGQHNPQILKGCGQDATEMFNQERKHQGGKAQDLLSKYVIGVLK